MPLPKPFARNGSHARPQAGRRPALAGIALLAAAACTPTVKVATDEPITINLNVNIKHEILVRVDRELDSLFSSGSGLF